MSSTSDAQPVRVKLTARRLLLQAPGDGAQSDSSSCDLLDILLQEDSRSATGSATSSSTGSGSGSAGGASGSGTGQSRCELNLDVSY